MNPGILTQGYAPVLMPGGLLGSPTPIAMPDQAWHPEALDWRNRVRANGGDVSQDTMAAVNRFCMDIDAAGLRDRFYRLNLLCGSNLSACLVPLYRGPEPLSTVFGSAVDTNVNWVSSNYTETGRTGGLFDSQNATKYLNTGLAPESLDTTATGHLAFCHHRVLIPIGQSWCGVGAYSATQRYLLRIDSDGTIPRIVAFWGTTGSIVRQFATSSVQPGGVVVVSRNAPNDARLFRNGVQELLATTSVTAARHAFPWFVGANNNVGSPEQFNRSVQRFYSIGRGLSVEAVQRFSECVRKFMESLGRVD